MATWESLARYVKSNYRIDQDDIDLLGLTFDVGGGRSQKLIVRKLRLGDDEWAEVSTPIAKVAEVDPRDCMERNGNMVVGGLAFFGDLVIFRHSLPLADLDISEFEVPLKVVVHYGDQLESELVGGDRF